MEENNLNNNEELENQAEETEKIERVAEETEYSEETAEEYAEESSEEYEEQAEEPAPKDPRKPLMIVIAVMAVVILALGGVLIWKVMPKNSAKNSAKNITNVQEYYKYVRALEATEEEENKKNEEANTNRYNNFGYKNISGRTLGDIYEQAGYEEAGISFKAFLKMNALPEDMTKDIYMEVAQYLMPLYAASLDAETLAEEFNLESVTSDSGEKWEIDMNMPLGLVLDEMTVLNGCKFMGMDEDLDALKEKYGFGDEVTEETKWKEVRAKIEEVDMQEALEEEKAEEAEEQDMQATESEEAQLQEEAEQAQTTEEVSE